MTHSIIVVDNDFPQDAPRRIISGSQAYCEQYVAQSIAEDWEALRAYVAQPQRWTISIIEEDRS